MKKKGKSINKLNRNFITSVGLISAFFVTGALAYAINQSLLGNSSSAASWGGIGLKGVTPSTRNPINTPTQPKSVAPTATVQHISACSVQGGVYPNAPACSGGPTQPGETAQGGEIVVTRNCYNHSASDQCFWYSYCAGTTYVAEAYDTEKECREAHPQ